MTQNGNKPKTDIGRAASGQPTLKDIAFMTGLAVTTVSRALKDAPDISTATKQRVRLVADQIGYRPNRAGVRLRTGKTNVIALVISIEIESMGLTPYMVMGLSDVLKNTAYHLILTPYDSKDDDPLDPVRYVVETGSADAIIISRTQPDDPRIRYLTDRNFHFATHGRSDMGIEHAYHDFDNNAFAAVGVRRLVDLGRSRLALLAPPMELSYSRHMMEGFVTEVDKLDLTEVSLRGLHIDLEFDDIRDGIARLMKSRNRPDGLICGGSEAVLAAVAGIEAAGLTVGEDIDVVGKEAFGMLQKFRPAISVVQEDFREAGRKLAEAVIAQINGEPADAFQSMEVPEA